MCAWSKKCLIMLEIRNFWPVLKLLECVLNSFPVGGLPGLFIFVL